MQFANTQKWITEARRLAARWLMPNQPVESDETMQIAICAEGTFSPSAFGGRGYNLSFAKGNARAEARVDASGDALTGALKQRLRGGWSVVSISEEKPIGLLPTISGTTRVYTGFRPKRIVATEQITATFSGPGLPDLVVHRQVADAADVVLIQAFAGAYNCFPNAPSQGNGISGAVFSPLSLAGNIDWPRVNAGIDLAVAWAIQPSILSRAANDLPAGYDPVPRVLSVQVRTNLMGPILRYGRN